MAAGKCQGYRSHWFAYYKHVGSSAPTCRRCGADNPNYDRDRDVYADREYGTGGRDG